MRDIDIFRILLKVHCEYTEYLYDKDDERPLNNSLRSFGLPIIGKLKVKLKDDLDGGWSAFSGGVYVVSEVGNGTNWNIFLEGVDGEFDISQIVDLSL
jgi:hypothetical protein